MLMEQRQMIDRISEIITKILIGGVVMYVILGMLYAVLLMAKVA